MARMSTAKTPQKAEYALTIKDWLKAPIFSPVKQTAPREVEVTNDKGQSHLWRMGVPNPLNQKPSSRIDMSHARVLLAILSFWRHQNPVSLSLSELARRCANAEGGGSYYKRLRGKIEDLRQYWIELETPNGQHRIFPALARVEVTLHPKSPNAPASRQGRLALEGPAAVPAGRILLDNVELAPEFAEFLIGFADYMHFRLDVLRNMPSDVAQAIYLYLPSRAVHHTRQNPWQITLTNLYNELGLKVASAKSLRKKVLVQHRRSVLSQLNGAPVLKGTLRATLRLNQAGTDWMLLAWTETDEKLLDPNESNSQLAQAWRDSGRPEKEFQTLLKAPLRPLTDEDHALCEAARIDLNGTERFLRLCKTILSGPVFRRQLAELKVDVIESRGVQNPTGALIWRLLQAIREPVAAPRRSPSD